MPSAPTPGVARADGQRAGGDRRGSAGRAGRVIWDLDWRARRRSGGRIRKLSIIDTGVGMSPEQMRYYINHLAATSHQQGRTKNYGVGRQDRCRLAQPARTRVPLLAPGRRGARAASSATRTDGGDSSPRIGATGGGTSGARSARAKSRGCCAGARTAPRWCCSVNTSVTTPPGAHERQRSPPTWVARYLNTHFLRLPERVELLVRDARQGTCGATPASLSASSGSCTTSNGEQSPPAWSS